jgi:hypothetical protein
VLSTVFGMQLTLSDMGVTAEKGAADYSTVFKPPMPLLALGHTFDIGHQ